MFIKMNTIVSKEDYTKILNILLNDEVYKEEIDYYMDEYGLIYIQENVLNKIFETHIIKTNNKGEEKINLIDYKKDI